MTLWNTVTWKNLLKHCFDQFSQRVSKLLIHWVFPAPLLRCVTSDSYSTSL